MVILKNKFLILSIATLQLLALCACEKTNSTNTISTNLTYTTSASNVEKAIYTGSHQQEYAVVKDFIEALKVKDTNYLNNISLMNSVDKYNFINNVDILNFNIKYSKTEKNVSDFIVTLEILNSESDSFLTGEQQYLIGIDLSNNVTNIRYFKHAKDNKNFSYNVPKTNVEAFCFYSALCFLNDFNSNTDLNNQTLINQYAKNCFVSYNNTHAKSQSVKLDNLTEYLSINQSIDPQLLKKSSYYNANTDSLEMLDTLHNYIWYSSEIVSFDETTKQYVVNIDLYADSLFLVKAKSLQLTISNDSDTLKAIDVKTIFTSDNSALSMLF